MRILKRLTQRNLQTFYFSGSKWNEAKEYEWCFFHFKDIKPSE